MLYFDLTGDASVTSNAISRDVEERLRLMLTLADPAIIFDLRINNGFNGTKFDAFWDENKTSFVFEPGVTVRLGYQNVKLQFQYSHSSLSHEWPDGSESYSAVFDNFASFGIFILFSDRWKKTESK